VTYCSCSNGCSGVLSVSENKGIERIVMRPNPMNDFTEITLNSEMGAYFDCTIYNASGQVVRTTSSQNTGVYRIDRKDLSAGFYLIQFRFETGAIASGKLLVK